MNIYVLDEIVKSETKNSIEIPKTKNKKFRETEKHKKHVTQKNKRIYINLEIIYTIFNIFESYFETYKEKKTTSIRCDILFTFSL